MITYVISIILLFAVMVLKIPEISVWMSMHSYISSLYMSGIFFIVFLALPDGRKPARPTVQRQVFFQAITGALIFIAVSFFLGALLAEIKRTPYDLSITGIINNIFIVVPAILAREKIREYIITNIWRRKIAFKVFVVLMLFLLSDLNFPNLEQLKSEQEILIYIAQYTVPALMNGILLIVLSFYGGFRASAAYALTYVLFTRLFPFLPDLTWLAESAIGIIFPVIYSMVIRDSAAARESGKRRNEAITPGYICSLIFTILIIWFSVGVFPVYPTVILTGSMEPLIKPGDMILIKKAFNQEEIEDYRVGDIINFDRDSINVTHRIIEVLVDEAGNFSFRTKGDNNLSEDDDIVELSEVNGKQIFTIPKIGFPALLLRSRQRIPEGVTDNSVK